MSETATALGDNAAAELKRRVDRRLEILDQVAELQETLKGFKAEDKADGYTEKAIGVVIKGLRGDAEDHANQITFETIVDTYRKACGLPVDLETAYARVRDETGKLPEDDGGDDAHD